MQYKNTSYVVGVIYFGLNQSILGVLIFKYFDTCASTFVGYATTYMAALPQCSDGVARCYA